LAGQQTANAEEENPDTPSALYRRYAVDLRRLLRALLRNQEDAEDALQQVFLKLLDAWESFDPATAKGWLFTVAYREAMTLRRRRAWDQAALVRLWQQPVPQAKQSDSMPENAAFRDEIRQTVQAALRSLPDEQRQVVEQRLYEGKTFAEIARQSGLPLGTVLTRMRLALQKLRHLVEANE
jgi:RNA polymerase sigma-70 factor, ECF subfamily